MKNKVNLTVQNARRGQKIKICVPRIWLDQSLSPAKYKSNIWLKAKVYVVHQFGDDVVAVGINTKLLRRKHTTLHKDIFTGYMYVEPHKETGVFGNIYLAK